MDKQALLTFSVDYEGSSLARDELALLTFSLVVKEVL